MQIEHNLYCEDCGHTEYQTGYHLRKRKNKKEFLRDLNCIDCNRPFKVRESEKDWKKHCFTCWLKLKGVPVICQNCEKNVLVWEPNSQDLCRACYIKEIGIKRQCDKCTIDYYIHPKDSNKTLCYDCYTKKEGVRKKCVDCKNTIFVLKKNLSWKKKCGDCYYKL